MLNPFQGMALPRAQLDRIKRQAIRIHAASAGAAKRLEAAQAKRDRKNAKRAEIARRNAS